MQLVHEIGKVRRRPVTTGRRIVRRHLIAPACVERILGYAHKLDVSIAHVLKIRNYLVGEFAIRKSVAVLISTPRPHMTFVYIYGFRVRSRFRLHILAVGKLVIVEGIDLACRSLMRLGMKGVWIGLVQPALYRVEVVLVIIETLYSLCLSFPHTRGVLESLERAGVDIPVVEVAHHAYALCGGRPHAKYGARALLVKLTSHEAVGVCANSAVELRLRAYVEFHYFLQ